MFASFAILFFIGNYFSQDLINGGVGDISFNSISMVLFLFLRHRVSQYCHQAGQSYDKNQEIEETGHNQ